MIIVVKLKIKCVPELLLFIFPTKSSKDPAAELPKQSVGQAHQSGGAGNISNLTSRIISLSWFLTRSSGTNILS